MTLEGLGEMFEGDSADTCAGKFTLVSMGGRAEGLEYADQGARTPIGASGNYSYPQQICNKISNPNFKSFSFSMISMMLYSWPNCNRFILKLHRKSKLQQLLTRKENLSLALETFLGE